MFAFGRMLQGEFRLRQLIHPVDANLISQCSHCHRQRHCCWFHKPSLRQHFLVHFLHFFGTDPQALLDLARKNVVCRFKPLLFAFRRRLKEGLSLRQLQHSINTYILLKCSHLHLRHCPKFRRNCQQFLTNRDTLIMTLRVSDWQSDLYSICNSCDDLDLTDDEILACEDAMFGTTVSKRSLK